MVKQQQLLQTIQAKSLAIWEIISILLSCLIAEWVVLAFFSRSRAMVFVPVVLALALMMISHQIYRESLRDLGFRIDNFVACIRLLVVPTTIAVLLIIFAGWWLRAGEPFPPLSRPRLLTLPFWGLFQQYVLQGYINRRAQIAFGKGVLSIIVVAIVFSLVHLPNPVLAGLTLIGGIVWATVYQRQPNLFAIALSHAIVSLSLTVSIPVNLVTGMRVGFKFFG